MQNVLPRLNDFRAWGPSQNWKSESSENSIWWWSWCVMLLGRHAWQKEKGGAPCRRSLRLCLLACPSSVYVSRTLNQPTRENIANSKVSWVWTTWTPFISLIAARTIRFKPTMSITSSMLSEAALSCTSHQLCENFLSLTQLGKHIHCTTTCAGICPEINLLLSSALPTASSDDRPLSNTLQKW